MRRTLLIVFVRLLVCLLAGLFVWWFLFALVWQVMLTVPLKQPPKPENPPAANSKTLNGLTRRVLAGYLHAVTCTGTRYKPYTPNLKARNPKR